MPFGHKAGLPPSKKYLLMRQPLYDDLQHWTKAVVSYIRRSRLFHFRKVFTVDQTGILGSQIAVEGDHV